MRKIILFLALLMVSSAFADEKPGRFFKDQPDVTNDPQVHFISVSYTHLTLPTNREV